MKTRSKKIDFNVRSLEHNFFSKLSPQLVPRDCGPTKGVWPTMPKTFQHLSEDIFRCNFKNMLIYFFVPKKITPIVLSCRLLFNDRDRIFSSKSREVVNKEMFFCERSSGHFVSNFDYALKNFLPNGPPKFHSLIFKK